MYFDFSKEQYLARDSGREFLAERLSSSRLRQLVDTGTGFDREVWRALAELGWMSVLIPERHGGLGLGFLDLALLCEESGRALLPAPILETAIMLPMVLAHGTVAQRDAWLPRLVTGDIVGSVALAGRDGFPPACGIPVHARRDGAGFVLDGEVLLVPFGCIADVMLVPARVEDGDDVVLVLVERADDGIAATPIAGLDPTMRLAAINFTGVRVGPDRIIGTAGRGRLILERALRAGSTAVALQAVGGAGRALEMAVEYAKLRHQFGKPIGAFQAIKHKCADMMVQHETTRSGVYYAAWAVGADAPDATAAAAMAKALSTEMFCFVAGEAIQVHGGIGFTWEHDLHFHFKRAKYLEFVLGTPAEHRAVVAATLST